jgi:hypothetical protein
MEKQERRSLKARLTLIDTNLKACRAMLGNPETFKAEKFHCHVQGMLENGGELLTLLGTQLHFEIDSTVNGVGV